MASGGLVLSATPSRRGAGLRPRRAAAARRGRPGTGSAWRGLPLPRRGFEPPHPHSSPAAGRGPGAAGGARRERVPGRSGAGEGFGIREGWGGGQRLATEAGGLGEGEEKPKTKEVGRGGGSGELTRGEVAGAQEDGNTGKTFPFVLEHLNVASGQGLGQRGSLSLWPGPAPVPAPAQGISPAGSGCQKPFHPSHCLHEASLPPPWARQPLLLRVQEPFPRPRLPSRRSTSSSCFGSGFFFLIFHFEVPIWTSAREGVVELWFGHLKDAVPWRQTPAPLPLFMELLDAGP